VTPDGFDQSQLADGPHRQDDAAALGELIAMYPGLGQRLNEPTGPFGALRVARPPGGHRCT